VGTVCAYQGSSHHHWVSIHASQCRHGAGVWWRGWQTTLKHKAPAMAQLFMSQTLVHVLALGT
jgi:hypothetical protein